MKKSLTGLAPVGVIMSGALAAVTPSVATAEDIDALQNLVQGEFRGLTEDLGAALSYKSLSPAEALGVTGFDLSLSVSGTSLDSLRTWEKATDDDDIPSTLPVPMLRVAKGLPFNIDVGAFYLTVPDTNVRLIGGEVRWAFIEGGVATPAVSLHGTYAKVSGVDQLDLDIKTLDVSISKGFTVLTPYAGVGQVWTKASPVGVPQLRSENITQTKVFGGLNFNFGLPNIAAEVDQTGGITSYGVKVGLRW